LNPISRLRDVQSGRLLSETSYGGHLHATSTTEIDRERVFRPAGNSLQWLKMKKIVRMAVLVALGSLYGCGSSSNPAMSGSWLFVLTPTGSSSPILQFTSNLTQIGTQFTGQVTLTGSSAACGTAASITGTVMGNSLNFTLSQISSSINFTGTTNLAFTSASGTYTGASNSCLVNSGFGSWSAALQ